ncbi:hypothetical protein IWQ61_003353 [Dispira simplex]|nr:hypothetical protein IWQ61_003353 [Dispira simplex]
MVYPQPFILNTGVTMPAIGLGTWRASPGEMDQIIGEAWNAGYRHIDCSPLYGNEREIGTALKRTRVVRDQLWLTSKLWNTEHHPDHVGLACEKNLHDLQVDYLDLYLMHWSLAFEHGQDQIPRDVQGNVKLANVPIIDTWRAMETLVDQGKVRQIGVSNFTVEQLEDLLAHARIKPVVNQIECHPYLPQNQLVDFCRKQNILVMAYRPLGGRQKTERSNGVIPREDPIIKQVGQRHGKTPAQVCLAWLLQRGISIIPKSASPTRLRENLIDFTLTEQDMADIASITTRYRSCDPAAMWGRNLQYLPDPRE